MTGNIFQRSGRGTAFMRATLYEEPRGLSIEAPSGAALFIHPRFPVFFPGGGEVRMARILKVQHWQPEFQYNDEDFFAQRGDRVDHLLLFAGEAAPDPRLYDLAIVYGGYMSAFDDAGQPWLARELRFLEECLKAGTPVLGICLGSQLLARAPRREGIPQPGARVRIQADPAQRGRRRRPRPRAPSATRAAASSRSSGTTTPGTCRPAPSSWPRATPGRIKPSATGPTSSRSSSTSSSLNRTWPGPSRGPRRAWPLTPTAEDARGLRRPEPSIREIRTNMEKVLSAMLARRGPRPRPALREP